MDTVSLRRQVNTIAGALDGGDPWKRQERRSAYGQFRQMIPEYSERALDALQMGLGVLGMLPGAGNVFDLANAGISVARGKYADATFNLAAAMPATGLVVGGVVIAKTAIRWMKAGRRVDKAVDAYKAVKKIRRTNADLVREVAARAERWGVKKGYGAAGAGPRQGALKLGYSDRLLQRYQRMEQHRTGFVRGVETETSWLNHAPVPHGTKGSARLDVWDPSAGTVFDYKFVRHPGRGLGTRQINHINNNGPIRIQSIDEINP